MLKGLHLTILAGPVIPVPLPQPVTDALTAATVTIGEDEATFQLTFTLAARSVLIPIFLLAGGGAPIPLRLAMIATLNGLPEVLIDGLVTNTQASPGSGGKPGSLSVTGRDLSAAMDLIDFTGLPYPALPAEAQVELIVAKYAFLGVIPLVIPTPFPDIPLPIERIPTHEGTDLAYVRKLASWMGYTFHMLMPAPGVNLAYWGPKLRIGLPQSAVNIDMDAETNVESMHFSFDNDAGVLPIVNVQVPDTTVWIPVPVPPVSLLNPPYGLIPPLQAKIRMLPETGGMSTVQALLWGLAAAADSFDSTKVDGTLDVVRYGGILKARGIVGVRGGGIGFDGLYFVKSVTHTISRGDYKQSFELVRNGLVSTLPVVPP